MIQHFAPLLQNQHVLIHTDNKATAAHINQQGGVRSAQLLMVDRNLAFSTVKTYAAAISSCHEGFGDRSVFSHPLMKRFLRGVWRHRPVSRSLAPQWDLALVLRALIKAPFEPLDQVPLKFLAAKTALLLALTSAQRVSDLHALSVAPSCLRTQGGSHVSSALPCECAILLRGAHCCLVTHPASVCALQGTVSVTPPVCSAPVTLAV